jgi:hypothetical protein
MYSKLDVLIMLLLYLSTHAPDGLIKDTELLVLIKKDTE